MDQKNLPVDQEARASQQVILLDQAKITIEIDAITSAQQEAAQANASRPARQQLRGYLVITPRPIGQLTPVP
jgi:hypothetical protein